LYGLFMITKEDAMAFVKQLEELKAEQQLKDDRGPLDLTRRIDELEAENKTLKERLDKLQKVMFDQFRNKGAL
jgi:chaperonin cofactor prefoldin